MEQLLGYEVMSADRTTGVGKNVGGLNEMAVRERKANQRCPVPGSRSRLRSREHIEFLFCAM